MRDLIARLEAATGPDRELDAEIADAIGFDPTCLHSPAYTASLDAALTLVTEGWQWFVNWKAAHLWRLDGDNVIKTHKSAAATPTISLCIAALCARMEDGA